MDYEKYIYRMTQLLDISVEHAEEVYFIYRYCGELDRLESVLQGLEECITTLCNKDMKV